MGAKCTWKGGTPQREGHSPWEEPLWPRWLPRSGESVGPASMLVAIIGQAQELLGTASFLPWGLWALGYGRHSSWDSGYQSPKTSCSNRAVSASISSNLSLLPLPGCWHQGPGPQVLLHLGIAGLARHLLSLLWQHPEWGPTKAGYY